MTIGKSEWGRKKTDRISGWISTMTPKQADADRKLDRVRYETKKYRDEYIRQKRRVASTMCFIIVEPDD